VPAIVGSAAIGRSPQRARERFAPIVAFLLPRICSAPGIFAAAIETWLSRAIPRAAMRHFYRPGRGQVNEIRCGILSLLQKYVID
jgi:hypothetical protein